MNNYWLIGAVTLVAAFVYSYIKLSKLIARLSGREVRPEKSTAGYYSAIYFGIAFGIGIPPIYLLPDSDPLVYTTFMFVGLLAGTCAAQALFGRRVAEYGDR
jgi:hypothetical protein